MITIDDGVLAHEVAGEGDPVVLLHAGGLDMTTWDRQFALLATTHLVVRYDARGHGRSSTPTGPFAHYVDLLRLLDALALDRVTLVGLSLGARTSIDFALTHPDRVTALLAVATGISGMVFEDPYVLDLVARLGRARSLDEGVELFLRLWVDGPHRTPDRTPAAVREPCRRAVEATLARHGPTGFLLPVDIGSIARVHDLAPRTLGVVGDLDSSDIRRVTRLLPAHVTIPGAGHVVNLDQPDAFDQVLLDFLTR
ncbi:alpha/beta hydrolase [Actinosynnema sp. NPDC020468]|uniref:alpha/beta fold hydrolase n=1 Tax=Actinosynnema sp. NPDC020468 TaxID=3154488 RepID=UPI003405281B